MPVLTMHTIGDGLVVPENEAAYARAVAKAGESALLRQVFVDRAGHCAFTPAETITAAKVLLNRLKTGQWNDGGLTPAMLNARAGALGPAYNVYGSSGKLVRDPAGLPAVHPGALPAPVRRAVTAARVTARRHRCAWR